MQSSFRLAMTGSLSFALSKCSKEMMAAVQRHPYVPKYNCKRERESERERERERESRS